MKHPDLPIDEKTRLDVIDSLEFLRRTTDQEIEDIIQLTSDFCDTPIVLVSIIKEKEQYFYANKGLGVSSTPRDISFCGHAILQDDIFEVRDATADERFFDNPLVTGDPDIAFYAGQPLNVKGHNIGTLCVIDRKPRKLNFLQSRFLKIMGRQIENIMHQKDLADNYLNVVNDYQRYTHELEGSLKQFQHIISAISHDAIGPVKSVKSLFDMSQADSSMDPADFMEAMEESLKSSEKVLNDLLTWGIHELKKENRNKMPVNLLDVAGELGEQMAFNFKFKENIFLYPAGNLVMHTDGNKLRFILRNLLVNANKFTQNGTIRLDWWKDESKIYLQVNDSGRGMNEEQLHLLNFLDSAGSSKGTHGESGFGIGLQLVRKFCHELDGDLLFESDPGTGVTCTLLFPCN